MFIDYITLMLINMTAGFLILAWFVHAGLEETDRTRWTPGFAAVGVVALITGTHMTLAWPIPKLPAANLTFANAAFGEMTVLLGVLFLGAALACAKGWRLDALGVYACVAGVAAVVVGAQLWRLGLTKNPPLTGIGFLLSGLSGILFGPLVWYAKGRRSVRAALAAVLVVSALIWALVGYTAYWDHIARFGS